MKKADCKIRLLGAFLSLLMVLSVITLPTLKPKASAGTIDDFVKRCYQVTLDRGPDSNGFAYWKGKLLNGEAVGIEVAYGFLFSPEYTNKNKSESAYVKDLYTLFMGRDPEESGYNYWMNQFKEGKSRLDVFAGFANSQEFYDICASYGITAGRYVMGYDRDTINNVNLFVERLYKTCLGRIGDRGGQEDWTEKLIKKQITGSDCAKSFIFSPEYTNKGLSDKDYVENLYKALMGRASDANGKKDWLNNINNGMTRDQVFEGFVNSPEFDNICKTYGINRGSYKATDVPKYKVGDIIKYGKYEQDGNTSNGKEDIEWIVLKVEKNKIYVTSKYILDYQPYDKSAKDVTWETCSLRKWLNNDFYNAAFSENEKQAIPLTTNKNPKNPVFNDTVPLNDTKDKVFLLSVEDTMKFFGECVYHDEEYDFYYYKGLFTAPTEYVKKQGIDWWTLDDEDYEYSYIKWGFKREEILGVQSAAWYLRSQAQSPDCALEVWAGARTGYGENTNADDYHGVRPAMYISY